MISTPFVAVPPLRYGGTELVVAALVDGLVARGHRVTLYAPPDSTAGTTVRSHYPRTMWPPDPQRELVHAATSIWDILGHPDVDLVHTHSASGLAFAPLLGRPLVYTVHHSREEGTCELVRAASARAAVSVIAISERQRVLLSEPATVIHHGLPPGRYPKGRGDGGYAAFVGRFAAEKGVHTALDVAHRAGVPIRLGGRAHPNDEVFFQDEVEERLQRPGVRWFGELGMEGKVRLLGGAVATLFPIAWEEPFGLVMIESMLCGTPVLAFAHGSVPEVVEDGVTGFVEPDEEAMAQRLQRIASGRQRFDRRRCRAVAIARFGADRMVDRYEALYHAALGQPAWAVEAR